MTGTSLGKSKISPTGNSSDVSVLGISGSPHRHGNTETLLDAFLDGARDAGAEVEVEKVVIKNLIYRSCQGCNACHKDGVCILTDDFTPLFEKILSVDVLAIASPIYSMGITAELKSLIDRAQPYWARKFVLKTLYFDYGHYQSHKGLFISTAGQSWDHVFDGAFPVVNAFFSDMGFEYYDNVIANKMDEYGGIKGHPAAMNDAFAKGQKVVRVVKKIKKKKSSEEETDDSVQAPPVVE
ncbi:MAG: flavodoxin family protein [Methanomicrobiaceae archaeon]|nr:flavodoxin family protein [Methanomicrobiaceae archaeon]